MSKKVRIAIWLGLIVFLAVGATMSPKAVGSGSNDWHDMSQSERNDAILDRADDDLSDEVGESCKEWVRTVIEDASNGHVIIPPNNNSGDSWELDEHVFGFCTSILNAKPGEIVQMRWKDNPDVPEDFNIHTAIVYSVSGSGVRFIESNYDTTPGPEGPEYVTKRYVSEDDFNKQVKSFTICRIR